MINAPITNPVNKADFFINDCIHILNDFCTGNNWTYGEINCFLIMILVISISSFSLSFIFNLFHFRKLSIITGTIGFIFAILFPVSCMEIFSRSIA